MLSGLWTTKSVLICLWLPLAATLGVFISLSIYWNGKIAAAPKKTIELPAEFFREAINAALTVTGFIVPLLAAALGYFAVEQVVTPLALVPLVASTALFVLSLLAGLWNLFSLTAVQGDKVVMTGEDSGGYVPQFVTQLVLMGLGFLVAVIYLLSFFQVPKKKAEGAGGAPVPAQIAAPAAGRTGEFMPSPLPPANAAGASHFAIRLDLRPAEPTTQNPPAPRP